MNKQDIARRIRQTLLNITASDNDIRNLCLQAVENDFQAVCIQPMWTDLAPK